MNLIKVFLAMVFALGFAFLGFNLPSNFRSVDPRVLATAGEETKDLQTLAMDRLAQEQSSPVKLLKEAGLVQVAPDEINRIAGLRSYYQYMGGPDEHFRIFLQRIGEKEIQASLEPRGEDDTFSPTVFLLLRDSNREAIEVYLGESESPGISRLLESRFIEGMVTIDPVHPISGPTLDMAVLTTAMLLKGNYFDPRLERWLTQRTEEAIRGDGHSISELKRFYTALLTLSVYLDWAQLKELIRTYDDWYPLEKTVYLLRNYAGSASGFQNSAVTLKEAVSGEQEEEQAITLHPDYRPLIYSAILFSSNPGGVVSFIEQYKEDAFPDLEQAIRLNKGALDLLLQKQLPIYKIPATLGFLHYIGDSLQRFQMHSFLVFVVEHPVQAILLRIFFLTLAGTFLMGDFVTGLGDVLPGRAQNVMGRALGYLMVGFVAAALTTIWVEPNILKGVEHKFDFDVENLFNSVHIDMTTLANTAAAVPQETNHSVTVGIMIGFLVIQMILFILGLLKVKQIKNDPGSTVLKLRLLENEENLFDTGLYVGLAGTVISLILLKLLELKEASLVAAYSSTLFGILFVAILKIGFVRPYRNELIREQEMMYDD